MALTMLPTMNKVAINGFVKKSAKNKRYSDPTSRVIPVFVSQSLKDNMGKSCKCHGVSGSCTVKICWRTMPNFNIVAELLRKKFDRSTRVRPNSNKTKLLKTTRGKRGKRRKRKSRRPSASDLVFTKDSPDFCQPDPRQGIYGTRGRLCNKTSSHGDGCKNMCCGNGYNTIERSSKVKCNCEFIWCCKVQCELCEKDWFEYRCK
ncbi:hypothetical protein QZH41_016789 [Actinostola sp. cb2023]|nr:hypothetical protein QZH41_016789 [Actinostola sp. cb2023]